MANAPIVAIAIKKCSSRTFPLKIFLIAFNTISNPTIKYEIIYNALFIKSFSKGISIAIKNKTNEIIICIKFFFITSSYLCSMCSIPNSNRPFT